VWQQSLLPAQSGLLIAFIAANVSNDNRTNNTHKTQEHNMQKWWAPSPLRVIPEVERDGEVFKYPFSNFVVIGKDCLGFG
jgi:hypothetical protein